MMFPPRIQQVIDRVDALRHTAADHWQIPADEALLLAQLIRVGRYTRICEIGTSYGFSTLHFAAAVSEGGGVVHTIDAEPRKTAAARDHIEQAGLSHAVVFHTGRAQDILRDLAASDPPLAPFDFAFIDAVKSECFDYLAALTPLLSPRCALATDNTTTHAAELAPFVTHLRSLPGFHSCNIPVGNGFELTVRR